LLLFFTPGSSDALNPEDKTMHWHDDDDDGELTKREISNAILLRWIVDFFKPHVRTLWIVLPIMLGAIALQLAVPAILKVIIDQNIAGQSMAGLPTWLGLYVASVLISLVLGYIFKVILGKMGLRIITTLKKKLFRHVVDLDLTFFEKYPPGVLIARLESDTEKLRYVCSMRKSFRL
jgi:ABC-type bacteriocin/lantibiotic exporter with double-glycine peptidase domain